MTSLAVAALNKRNRKRYGSQEVTACCSRHLRQRPLKSAWDVAAAAAAEAADAAAGSSREAAGGSHHDRVPAAAAAAVDDDTEARREGIFGRLPCHHFLARSVCN